MKQRIAQFLVRVAEWLHPSPGPQHFTGLATYVIPEYSNAPLETLKVANILRDGGLRHLHKRALEIFLEENSSQDEEAYWALPGYKRGAYLDRATAESIKEDD